MIDISKYFAYFHDGSLIGIQHSNGNLTLLLESAEMDLSDVQDDIQLSELKTIKGKLHINGLRSIQINGNDFFGYLEMGYDSGSIIDLQLTGNKMMIAISWKNFPPKPRINDFSTIEIEVETIWWENVPDLVDPFW